MTVRKNPIRMPANYKLSRKEEPESQAPAKRVSGCGHFLELGSQAADLARARVLVNHALGDSAHQLGLSRDECVLGGAGVASDDGFLEFTQDGPNARAARLVHFGAGGDLTDRLAGAGVVGQR